MEPPPPEMPAFEQRQPDRGGGTQRGSRSGGGDGHYGGRGGFQGGNSGKRSITLLST